jgi:hypothetical protein
VYLGKIGVGGEKKVTLALSYNAFFLLVAVACPSFSFVFIFVLYYGWGDC